MNSKKGQIAGQIFIYIMAVVVIGGIALIGYRAVNTIISKSCDAERINFKGNIEDMIERYNSDGSVNKQSVKAPCEYDTLCFVDADRIHTPPSPLTGVCSNAMINDSVRSGVEQNIFVISGKRTIPVGYSPLISLNSTNTNGCLCITQRNNNFNLVFRGRGSSTEINGG
ncbi:MAG: hypothetical protein ACP5NW_02995 [Candidatus Woesearchaeota archaeon]